MNFAGMLLRLRAGAKGHAQIYLDLEGPNIYRYANQFYLYNTYSGLWVKSQPFLVCASISGTMARVINLVMDELLRSAQVDIDVIRELKDWLTRTAHLTYCQQVMTEIPASNVPLQFNHHPDRHAYLPLKGCHNLDLVTGTVRQRKRDDLFTFDCPINYQPRANMYPLDLMISFMVGADQVRVVQSLLGICLTGWRSPITMIILCGPGRFQLLDPLIYLLDRFHWRYRPGQLMPPLTPSTQLNPSSDDDSTLIDLTKHPSVRCVTTLDPANHLDLGRVRALQTHGIKLIVVNSSTPSAPNETKPAIEGSTIIHVSSVKGTIDPSTFLPWLVDGVRLWYQHLHSNVPNVPDVTNLTKFNDVNDSDDATDVTNVANVTNIATMQAPEIDPYSPKSLVELE
jgi:hypothetical protein